MPTDGSPGPVTSANGRLPRPSASATGWLRIRDQLVTKLGAVPELRQQRGRCRWSMLSADGMRAPLPCNGDPEASKRSAQSQTAGHERCGGSGSAPRDGLSRGFPRVFGRGAARSGGRRIDDAHERLLTSGSLSSVRGQRDLPKVSHEGPPLAGQVVAVRAHQCGKNRSSHGARSVDRCSPLGRWPGDRCVDLCAGERRAGRRSGRVSWRPGRHLWDVQ